MAAARSRRTAATREVQKRVSDTYRPELSDPANLGLDPACRERDLIPHSTYNVAAAVVGYGTAGVSGGGIFVYVVE